jgi:hypothetical protein
MTALSQPIQALNHANEVRKGIADIKWKVRSLPSHTSAEYTADIIDGKLDDISGSLRIRPLVSCVRRLGDVKVTRCLVNAGIVNTDRRLRELTPRQRKAVAVQLRLWAMDVRR